MLHNKLFIPSWSPLIPEKMKNKKHFNWSNCAEDIGFKFFLWRRLLTFKFGPLKQISVWSKPDN